MACNCGFRKKIRQAGIGYIPKRSVYLDYNATTPVDPRTLGVLERMCRNTWGNPSSLHLSGIESWNTMEKCRNRIAEYFSCDAEGLFFCSSGTEALHGGMWGYAVKHPGSAVITSVIDHTAVRHPVRLLQLKGKPAFLLPVNSDGTILLEKLEETLRRFPGSIVVISPVNHETGSIQPLEEIHHLFYINQQFAKYTS